MNWWRRNKRERKKIIRSIRHLALVTRLFFFSLGVIYFSSFQFVFITIHKYFISIVYIFHSTLNWQFSVMYFVYFTNVFFSFSRNAFWIVYYSRSFLLNLLRAELTLLLAHSRFFFLGYYILCVFILIEPLWVILNSKCSRNASHSFTLLWTCVYAFYLYYFIWNV